MSSIIRRRRGLIVAIWGSCPEEGRCDNPHPLRQDASAQLPRRPSRAAGSFNPQFIAFDLPLDIVKQRYGGHFSVVEQGSSESIRILDLDGRRAFHLFRFPEFGPPIFHDGSSSGG